jgi:hypothetical protein
VTRTLRVDCLDVREAVAKGDPLSADAEAHRAACPVCGASMPTGGDEGGAALLTAIGGELGKERGASAWLRSLATRERVVGAALWVALLVTVIAVTLPRGRFAPVPMNRVVLVVTVMGALLALTLRLGLRPLQVPPPPPRVAIACFLGGLLAPSLFAFGPSMEAVDTPSAGIAGARGCFFIGAAIGALVVIALRVLDRGAHRSRGAALFAATAGGLAANAALELHCPSTAPVHLLLGHASVALVLVLVYGSLSRQSAG